LCEIFIDCFPFLRSCFEPKDEARSNIVNTIQNINVYRAKAEGICNLQMNTAFNGKHQKINLKSGIWKGQTSVKEAIFF